MRIRRPHELDYATLRTRQRVPLQPFVFVRASVSKEMERKKHQLPQKKTSKFVCMTHSRRKRSGYAPARVCTAILTVQTLSSFKRPVRMSRDCSATRNGNDGNARARMSHRHDTGRGERGERERARTVCTRVDRQRRTRDPEMQQVQHPASEQRVIRASGGLEQRVTQDRDRVWLGFQRLAEGREQVGLLLRICGYAERGGECLERVHRRRGFLLGSE